MVNTDGVKIFNIGKESLWPILLVQNFLPPNERYLNKNILLVGLYYGISSELPVHSIFQPLCDEFSELSSGFQIKEYPSIEFRAYVTHGSFNSPAKSKVQCFQQHNGRFGCCICYLNGTSVANKLNSKSTLRFLYKDELNYRKHRDTLSIMMMVKENHPIKGVKDISPLTGFEYFDLINSFGLDYLHGILKGPFEKSAILWFSTENKNEPYYVHPKKKAILENRIALLKGTKEMGKIRSISQINNFKAHEQRNFLLFIFPVLLNGIIPNMHINHFKLLSDSTFILLQEKISNEELCKCEDMLKVYVKEFETLYGKFNVTMNIHLLLHTVHIVKSLGPLWCYSTFCFETYNGVLRRFVKGTRDVLSQISRKYILNKSFTNEKNLHEIKIHPVGVAKLIAISDCNKCAFTQFPKFEKLSIFTSIKINKMSYTSTHYKTSNNIDYFLLLENDTIGKFIYYFQYKNMLYALIAIYKITNHHSHIKEIETSTQFAIKRVDTIKDKYIYLSYNFGMVSKRNLLFDGPISSRNLRDFQLCFSSINLKLMLIYFS